MGWIDRSIEFIERVRAAHTPEEVCRGLLSLTCDFGLTSLMAGIVNDDARAREPGMRRVVLCNWPQAWSNTFIAGNFYSDDPGMAEIGVLQARIHELVCAAAVSGIPDAVSPIDLNVRDIVSFSLVAPDGSLVGACLGGDRGYSKPELQLILVASSYAIGRAIDMLASAVPVSDVRLTSREIECLRWAALGKSEWEIGAILGISEHTSEKHLISARTKLGASNRVQAVAEAIRRKYI